MTNHNHQNIFAEDLLSLSDLMDSLMERRKMKYSENRRNRKFRSLDEDEKNIVNQMVLVKSKKSDVKKIMQ